MGKNSYSNQEELPRALRKNSRSKTSNYRINNEVPKALRNCKKTYNDDIPMALRNRRTSYYEDEEEISNRRIQRKPSTNRSNQVKTKKGKKKKRHIFRKLLIILILIVAILAGGLYWLIQDKLSKINYVEIDKGELAVSNNVTPGYRNIAILAIDSRDINNNQGSRSDGIIIASIDENSKNINLVSVYRDTYLQVEGHGLTKVTHAYAYGGPELAIKTLNQNLDLNISEFVSVNFESVASAIDAMGGVEIEIKDYEVEEMNLYIAETAEITGREENMIPGPGVYNLDGVQATTYGRIRQVGNGDYERTERMRTVIMKAFEKAKHLDPFTLNNLVDQILPKVQTNIDSQSIVGLMLQIGSYNMSENIGWPYETKGKTLDAWYGIPVTLEENVKQLHNELFNNTDYEVPQTVKDISKKIINKTGYSK
ncbi:MAG: LCP family protein [Clostridia bacterium]|nr:LCP family protein [Clostridia bacterium]